MASKQAIEQVRVEIARKMNYGNWSDRATATRLQWALDLLTAPDAVAALPEQWRDEAGSMEFPNNIRHQAMLSCADELDAAMKGEK